MPDEARQEDKEAPEKKVDRNVWLVGILLVIFLIAGLYSFVGPTTPTQKKDFVQAVGVLVAGIAGVGGLFFTWRNLRQTREDTDRQLEVARASTQETLQLTEQGQITERFTRAVEQLGETDDKEGKPKLEIRLGGIYALDWIARDSPEKYYVTILKVLTAYVRKNAALPSEESSEASAPQVKPRDDVQAVLDILGERQEDRTPEQSGVRLDLRKRYGVRLDLRETNLIGANLQGANLQGADLTEADLTEADLTEADLQGADLTEADLTEADLREADLQGADFLGAKLIGAKLQGAYLGGAYLGGANLRGADLLGADLQGADLLGADLQSTTLPEGFERPKSWIQPAAIPTEVKVFETSEQTGWLIVTENGLEYRLDDRRPGRRSGPRWTLTREQAKKYGQSMTIWLTHDISRVRGCSQLVVGGTGSIPKSFIQNQPSWSQR